MTQGVALAACCNTSTAPFLLLVLLLFRGGHPRAVARARAGAGAGARAAQFFNRLLGWHVAGPLALQTRASAAAGWSGRGLGEFPWRQRCRARGSRTRVTNHYTDQLCSLSRADTSDTTSVGMRLFGHRSRFCKQRDEAVCKRATTLYKIAHRSDRLRQTSARCWPNRARTPPPARQTRAPTAAGW